MASPPNPPSQTGGIIEKEEERSPAAQFRQFDVISDTSDHHFAITNGYECFTNSSSKLHKNIMKEWRILENDLPDSIYVRVYEQRIDLLRAMIVGPAGTPYHDGLFFFDIQFPPDYPTSPPKVHYRSFGLHLNPNLYKSGYVCLSLINTWPGIRFENWNPAKSTILQVLVSIQGLVLNEKPYFNEPGMGMFPGRVKRSIAYSEHVFVLSCKTMVYLLRRPPRNFKGIVAAHFRKRACDVVAACNAYINGQARVGYYGVNSESNGGSVSNKFKVAMGKVYGELVDAFTKNGSSLGHFIEQLEKVNEEKNLKLESKVDKVRKFGFKMVMRKIMSILGLKKGEKSKEIEVEVSTKK